MMTAGAMVGQGFIQITPSMRGFRKSVDREVSGAADSGAKRFGDRFRRAGSESGRTLGQSMKRTFDQSSAGIGGAALKSMQQEVAKAAQQLSRARIKQQDEAGKVRVAEARLAEAVKRGGADSASAVAATERLAAARRRSQVATDAVSAASNRLKSAQATVAAATASAGQAASSSWGSRMRDMVSRTASTVAEIGQKFAVGLRNVATGVVAAGAAAISTALVKGLGRLSGFDEALARMQGAGFDSDAISQAMEQAETAANGTAFALNDMAAAAALAMTNGIKPGQQLEKHLNSVRAVAAASGAPLNEISTIWGKLVQNAESGSAITTELQQMADRQIPIWNKLSEVMGVPIDHVKELASQGAISMDELYQATELAAGGMADAMGTTLPSKIKNTLAALGRLGQAFIGTRREGDELTGGLYPAFKSFFDMAREGINLVTALVTPFFQKWTDFAGSGVGDFFADLAEKFAAMTATVKEGGIGALGDGFKNLLSVVGPLGGAFAALGAGGLAGLLTRIPMLSALLPGLGGALSVLGGPIGIVAAALGGLALTGGDLGGLADGITSMVDTIVGALPGVVNTVVGLVPQIVEGILSAIPALMSAATQIIQSLLTGIITALPILLQGGLDIVLGLIEGVVAAIPMIVDGALALVEGLLSGIIAALPMLIEGALALVTGLLDGIVAALPLIIEGAVTLVTSLVQGLVSALPMLIDGALTLLMGLVQALITNLPLIIDAAIQLVTSLVQGLVEALPLLIQAAIDLVLQLVTAIVENLPLIIEAGIELLLSLITGILGALPELIASILEMVGVIVGTLLENLPLLIQAGIEILVAVIGGLLGAIPQLLEAIPVIASAIIDGLAGVDWLQLGMDIIQGIIDGLLSMGQALWGAVEGLVGGIVDFFPHSPAKKGPMSGSGYPGYSGRDMMDDFIGGMESRQSKVARTASAVAEAASFTADARYASSGVAGAPGTGAAGVQQVFNVPEGLTASDVADYAGHSLANALRR